MIWHRMWCEVVCCQSVAEVASMAAVMMGRWERLRGWFGDCSVCSVAGRQHLLTFSCYVMLLCYAYNLLV